MRLRKGMEMSLTAGSVTVLVLISGWVSNPPRLAASPAEAGAPRDRVDAFSRLDRNVDGVLSPREAEESRVLKGRFGDADANRDGSVDRSEFAAYELLREDGETEGPDAAPRQDSGPAPEHQGARDSESGQRASAGGQGSDSDSPAEDFRAADLDGNGNLSFSEFSAFRAAPATGNGPQAGEEGEPVISPARSQAFERLDRNGDDVIDYGEAAAVEVLRNGFGDADTDLNAEIDRAEFAAFVLDRSVDPPELPGRFGEPITEVPTPLE